MNDLLTVKMIRDWADDNGLNSDNISEISDNYLLYKSNDIGECFQLSIFPPHQGMVVIEAWSIETQDDRDLHCRWDIHVEELRRGLDMALSQVNEWLGLR